MLNFSKLDSYTMKLNKTEFDLFEAVQKTAEKYTALPENKTIALTQSGDNMICADRELMETVIKNLIDNAVKYSLPELECASFRLILSSFIVSVKPRFICVVPLFCFHLAPSLFSHLI